MPERWDLSEWMHCPFRTRHRTPRIWLPLASVPMGASRLLDPVAGHRSRGEALSVLFSCFFFYFHHSLTPLAWNFQLRQAMTSPFSPYLPHFASSIRTVGVRLASIRLTSSPEHLSRLRCISSLLFQYHTLLDVDADADQRLMHG